MTGFLIVSGLLLVVVLGIVLRPLIVESRREAKRTPTRELNLNILREQQADLEKEYRDGVIDQAAYENACEELEKRALDDSGSVAVAKTSGGKRPRLALALGVLLTAAAVFLYLALGETYTFGGKSKVEQPVADGSHALTQQQILGMVERLAEKLQSNPNDGQGWLMLARSYSVLGRFPESAAAYGRAVAMLPPDAQTFADFADTVAMAQGRKLQGPPESLVRKALEIDPRNIKALALLGTIHFERQEYRSAIGEWQKVLALLPPDSNVAAGIQGSVRDAESRLASAGGDTSAKVVKGGAVTGIVALDQSLVGKFSKEDTVFIFARAAKGPKMPLAILRKTVADLPLRFTLDDGMAMAPNLRLSQYPLVVVGARISKTGDALSRTGDWQGISEPIEPGGKDVKILINSQVN